MTWELKPLRFGGKCESCGAQIEVRATGWHSAELKKVRCTRCGPPSNDASAITRTEFYDDPVGGSAALREANARHDRKWVKGAAGEYLMDLSLRERLSKNTAILTDRRVPETTSNIDHLVVAPSGVWIIDTKNWKGRIEYKATTAFGIDNRLVVGGTDRSQAAEKMYSLVMPVAQAIGDRSVPVHPALVFIEGDRGTAATVRLLTKRPYQHLGVWITAPKVLAKLINAPGPLSPDAVQRLAERLDSVFAPA